MQYIRHLENARGLLSEAAQAWVITGKYQFGMPLYRQAALQRRFGGDLATNTLAAGVVRIGQAVQPGTTCCASICWTAIWSTATGPRFKFSWSRDSRRKARKRWYARSAHPYRSSASLVATLKSVRN